MSEPMVHSAVAIPGAGGLVAMTVSVLLFAGLSVGSYLLLFRVRGGPARHRSAERRLADQFARGQLDEREYRHLAAALEQLEQRQGPQPHPRGTVSRRRP